PSDLIPLTKEFPFVEWGILASASQRGKSPRFPGVAWVQELRSLDYPMNLSLHLCGRWVRELLMGRNILPGDEIDPAFQRVQLNFHAENTPCDPEAFCQALLSVGKNRQFIFQIDGAGGNK